MAEPERLVLGIETSCDDTCVAVLRGNSVLSNLISSQVDIHAAYGGVVPELAARAHSENIMPLLEMALIEADAGLGDIDLIAVTMGPGLVGALLVGVAAAKGLAWALDAPLVGVNHVEAHVYAHRLAHPEVPLGPSVCLVVSGGHTDLIQLDKGGRATLIGQTRDDAAGEAFDKVARLLDLGFPGGPVIDRMSSGGNPQALEFPRAWLEPDSLDFSFSGLKTAVAVHVERHGRPRGQDLEDLLASFQEAVVEVLVKRALKAAERTGVSTILVSGGVAANSRLRDMMGRACRERGLTALFPPLVLCTDNAAMVAALGLGRWQRGESDGLDLGVESGLRLG